MTGAPVRILVADDHEVVRRGVRALLEAETGWIVCGEAVTGGEAVEAVQRLTPDVAIVDIGMPELNGFEVSRRVRAASPRTEVLILTMHESEQVVHEAVAAGARGYVLKSDAGRDLVAAVDAVRRHQPFFTTHAQAVRIGRLEKSTPAAPSAASSLTQREREILQLLAEGKSNKDIAVFLGISTRTAETHRTRIMHKLDLHSLTELVRYAVRNKVVDP